jgi:hypothetical protein
MKTFNSNKNFQKLLLFSFSVALLFGCNKGALVGPADTASLNAAKIPKGYLVVSCQNCMVQYGMPDQYKTFNLSGTSAKAYFNYTPGYNLVSYITALGKAQSLTLTVYNKNNAVVYAGTVTQPTTGYWSSSVPLTDSTSNVTTSIVH